MVQKFAWTSDAVVDNPERNDIDCNIEDNDNFLGNNGNEKPTVDIPTVQQQPCLYRPPRPDKEGPDQLFFGISSIVTALRIFGFDFRPEKSDNGIIYMAFHVVFFTVSLISLANIFQVNYSGYRNEKFDYLAVTTNMATMAVYAGMLYQNSKMKHVIRSVLKFAEDFPVKHRVKLLDNHSRNIWFVVLFAVFYLPVSVTFAIMSGSPLFVSQSRLQLKYNLLFDVFGMDPKIIVVNWVLTTIQVIYLGFVNVLAMCLFCSCCLIVKIHMRSIEMATEDIKRAYNIESYEFVSRLTYLQKRHCKICDTLKAADMAFGFINFVWLAIEVTVMVLIVHQFVEEHRNRRNLLLLSLFFIINCISLVVKCGLAAGVNRERYVCMRLLSPYAIIPAEKAKLFKDSEIGFYDFLLYCEESSFKHCSITAWKLFSLDNGVVFAVACTVLTYTVLMRGWFLADFSVDKS